MNTTSPKLLSYYNMLSKGVARGGPGVPVTPPLTLSAFFNQTTYNRWRKRHDNIFAIVKKAFFKICFESKYFRQWLLSACTLVIPSCRLKYEPTDT